MNVAFGFMVYCLTCSGVEPVSTGALYSTLELCVRRAQERIEQVFPPGHRYDISCMAHGVQPGDTVIASFRPPAPTCELPGTGTVRIGFMGRAVRFVPMWLETESRWICVMAADASP